MSKIKAWLVSLAMTIGTYFGEAIVMVVLILFLIYQGVLV